MTTERLEPDVLVASSGLTGVVADIQADPDTKAGSWAAANPLRATASNSNVNIHCSLPTPTGDLNIGADLQEFRVLLRPFDAGQTGDPDWRIELWEFESSSWSLVRAGSTTEILNDAGDTVVAFTWDASELTTISGANVGIKVFGIKTGGSGSKRNTIDIGAVEWNVDYSSGQTISVGLATEADSSLAAAASKSLAAGLNTEADASLAVVAAKSVQTGLVTSTESSFAVAALKLLTTGLPVETDSSLALTIGGQEIAVNLASESDASLTLSALKALAAGLILEAAAALGVSRLKTIAIGLNTETDQVLASTIGLTYSVGLNSEVDTAFSVARLKMLIVGLATEIDIVLTVILLSVGVKLRRLGVRIGLGI